MPLARIDQLQNKMISQNFGAPWLSAIWVDDVGMGDKASLHTPMPTQKIEHSRKNTEKKTLKKEEEKTRSASFFQITQLVWFYASKNECEFAPMRKEMGGKMNRFSIIIHQIIKHFSESESMSNTR